MEHRHYIKYRRRFDLSCLFIAFFCVTLVMTQKGFSSQDISPNDISLKTIQDRVIQNERLYSLIKLDYTTKKSTSIPVSISDLVPRDPTESRTVEDSGASYVKNTWAQDDVKQHFNLNLYSDSNEWKSGFLHVVDGEVAKAGTLPDLMSGNITNSNDFPWGIVDMIYLGLRPFSGHQKLSELLVKEHASFDGEIDVIDKRKAYTIGIKRPGKKSFTKMWIDCERGMPIKYEHYDRHPDSSGARLISEVKTIELHQLPNGGWFPVKGTRTVHYRSPKSFLASDHITVDVNSITIKREDIPESLFNIDFPVGAKVYNAIKGITTIVAPTLSGKSLPDMKDFGINLSLADVNDKAILVRFFDMQQRPSRNCILHLSTRAQELRVKDVVIIAIQASKVEKAKLDEWVKENDISFDVGMIDSDSEKTRFNWGIKSLPWLILTNKMHVVIAEGFSIDELSERI